MKLINYNYGYNNFFNCSIHGKIILNEEEWKAIIKYLFNPAVKSYCLFKNILKEDIDRYIVTKKGRLYNIRVTATEIVATKFKLDRYKRGNYMFLVT